MSFNAAHHTLKFRPRRRGSPALFALQYPTLYAPPTERLAHKPFTHPTCFANGLLTAATSTVNRRGLAFLVPRTGRDEPAFTSALRCIFTDFLWFAVAGEAREYVHNGLERRSLLRREL